MKHLKIFYSEHIIYFLSNHMPLQKSTSCYKYKYGYLRQFDNHLQHITKNTLDIVFSSSRGREHVGHADKGYLYYLLQRANGQNISNVFIFQLVC